MEKFKKKDLFDLFENLKKLSNLKGVKFSYAMAKNAVIVEREIIAIEESLKPSDEFIKYEKERIELAKKHSEKDEKGNPKTTTKNEREIYVMEDKIGQLIGVVDHTFSITNSHDDKVQVAVKVDFSTASDADIKTWLTSNRIIAGQRPWRSLSKAELLELSGTTFVAQNIGKKVKSRAEQVQSMVNAGFPLKLAEYAVDNPDQFKDVMEKVEVPEGKEE